MRLVAAAFGSLIARPMRTLLTMLGIIIGVAAVYAMLAIGNGAEEKIMENLNSINARSISLSPDWSGGRASRRRPWRPFTESDVDAIRAIPGAEAVTGLTNGNASVVVPGTDWESDIRGTDQEYLIANDMALASGRNLTAADLDVSATVAVLGATVNKTLFGKSYAIGETIQIGRVPFKVVGVLEEYEPSWFGGRDPNDFILVPRTTARNRILGDNWLVRNNVERIQVVGYSQDVLPRIESEVDPILRRTRGLSASDAPDFRIFNFSANRQQAAESQRALSLLLATMGIVSLVVGGVGVMNIMLVSVTERTREIGLRMSLGARRTDILSQFLTEALLLCILSGLIGLGLGYGVSQLSLGTEDIEMVFSWQTALLAFGSSLLVGVVFGFLPARRASRLNPVEALRHE